VSTVFIVDGGKVRPQNVTIGARKGSLIEIVDGLHGGETLATSNLNQLSAGVTVAARRSTP
jgi:multidrug efflux pump subunit AcrA (membrane-fusion protein)